MKTGWSVRLAFRTALIAAVIGLFTGCVPLRYRCSDNTFPGLGPRFRLAAREGKTVHIVLVHGMRNHDPGYGSTFTSNLAVRLKLQPLNDEHREELPLPEVGVTNILRNYSYESGPMKMAVHELTWTPTVRRLKGAAFAQDKLLGGRRLPVNRMLKEDIVNDGFGDAVLYLNPSYQPHMQAPIRDTIKYVLQHSMPDEPIILVASSLGSKMTFDTVERWASDSAEEFAGRTTDIVMLANQIPLLNLGTRKVQNGRLADPESALKSFLKRAQTRRSILGRQMGDYGTTNIVQVIAATDPNDPLSYALRPSDIPAPQLNNGHTIEVLGVNVFSHNGWAFPWLFQNPMSAHAEYDQNEWMIKRIVHGGVGSRCLKAPEPPSANEEKQRTEEERRF